MTKSYNLEKDKFVYLGEEEFLKTSKISTRIHIDNNWTDAKDAGICIGNGTFLDPYIIKDLTVNGNGFRDCLLIKNSAVFFRIENCTFFNSGINYAGINFYNVSNSVINNNSFSLVGLGIKLIWSNDHVIKKNDLSCFSKGIDLVFSENTLILNNTIYDSNQGISLWYSDNNILSQNLVYQVSDGIRIERSDKNSILENTFNMNNGSGVYLIDSENITLLNNLMYGCGLQLNGNMVELCSYRIDTTNLVNGKPLYFYKNMINLSSNDFLGCGQIILVNCSQSTISALNLSNGTRGISLFYSSYINITSNTLSNFLRCGIFIEYCENSTLSENTLNFCPRGIYFYRSHYNTISNNIAQYNEFGIYIRTSHHNYISKNTLRFNGLGFYFIAGDFNTIFRNVIRTNYIGFYLIVSDYNEFIGNIVSDNTIGCSLLFSTYNRIIGSTVNDNQIGFQLEISNFNEITGNFLLDNEIPFLEINCEGNIFTYNYLGTRVGYFMFYAICCIAILSIFSRKKLKSLFKFLIKETQT